MHGVEVKVFRLLWYKLRLKKTKGLIRCFIAVTRISAKRHFWSVSSNHGVLGLGMCLGFRNRVLRLKMTLVFYLRTCTRMHLEENSLIIAATSFRLPLQSPWYFLTWSWVSVWNSEDG